MDKRDQRRRHKRYAVKWKAAVMFDRSTAKPTVHTETQDLSIGGTAIHTEHPDLTGSVVTFLLALPTYTEGGTAKMLKIRARIVSTFHTPGTARYRHGLSFLRAPDDGLDSLEELLRSSAPEVEIKAPEAAPPPAAAAAPSAGGRLAALKQAAQAKAAAPPEKRMDPQERTERRISDALERAFSYFKELVEQLNVLNPPYAARGYTIAGVPEFADFTWQSGDVARLTHDLPGGTTLVTRVRIDFRIGAKKPMLRVTRDYPASEKFKQLLKEYLIDFTANEARNDRGVTLKATFAFACEVKASLLLEGNAESGKLLLRMRNVGSFGMMDYVVSPDAVTQESLEELAGVLLGESPRVGPLLLRGA